MGFLLTLDNRLAKSKIDPGLISRCLAMGQVPGLSRTPDPLVQTASLTRYKAA
jgi:hypothetical protein